MSCIHKYLSVFHSVKALNLIYISDIQLNQREEKVWIKMHLGNYSRIITSKLKRKLEKYFLKHFCLVKSPQWKMIQVNCCLKVLKEARSKIVMSIATIIKGPSCNLDLEKVTSVTCVAYQWARMSICKPQKASNCDLDTE